MLVFAFKVFSKKGFKDLTTWLEKQNIPHLKACMEATGSYGEEIADYLYEQGHDVYVVNPAYPSYGLESS